MTLEELGIKDRLETTLCEFKSQLNEKDPINWLKTIDAFANTAGGRLYIGVDDSTHDVIGFNQKGVDRQVQLFIRYLKEHFKIIPNYKVSYYEFKEDSEERFLICINIEKAERLPIFVSYQGFSLAFIREEGRTAPAREDQIQEMVISTTCTPYDSLPTNVKFNQNDFTMLYKTYKEKNGNDLTEKKLSAMEFLSTKDGTLFRGSLLFKDGYSSDLTKVKCVKWPGIDKGSSYYLNEETINGNILESIDSCIKYIENNSDHGYKKENDGRIAVYSYPPRAVFEGIVNAFAHRNYFMDYMNIQIDIFVDRLEITSPGSLLNNEQLYKDKNITTLAPVRRNKLICQILEKLKMMEAIGSGFEKIEDEYRGKGEAYAPYVTASPSYFTLTLPNLLFSSGVVNEESTDLKLSYPKETTQKERDDKILSFCYYSPKTLEEIAAIIGIKPSSYLRKDIEDRLVGQSLLTIGNFKNKKKYSTNRNNVKIINQ